MMFADETKLIIGQYEHVGQHKNKLMCLKRTQIRGRINTKLFKEVIYGGGCNGRWEYIELVL